MARQATRKTFAEEELPEADLRPGTLHPRLNNSFFGHQKAVQEFLNALVSNRMPHAWLIQGPQGIGKATFAYRLAKHLLGAKKPFLDNSGTETKLQLNPDDPAIHQIMSNAHPDLFVLRRQWNFDTKKLRQTIAVDDVRKATRFFQFTSTGGKYRIEIVDNCDDLNRNGANALLKTLEEPPENGIFLLLSNSPGQLPATIHSRCRHLTLSGLGLEDFNAAMQACPDPNLQLDLNPQQMSRLHNLSKGSPGLAIDLVHGGGLKIQTEIEKILKNFPKIDFGLAHSLANKLARPGADPDYHLTLDLIKIWVQERARSNTANAADWATLWSRINELVSHALALNLDKRRTLLQILNMLPDYANSQAN